MLLVAFQAPGIVNRSGQQWLWFGGGHRVALLGAMKFNTPDNETEVRLGLERQGVSYKGQNSPIVKLGCNEEEFYGCIGECLPTRWSSDPDAYVVPEPAGTLLFGLAAFALRRR
jgi:MYXO-CTERM domain-containing protein